MLCVVQVEEPDELGGEYVRISGAKGRHLRRIKALKEASSIELDVTTVEHRCKRSATHTTHTKHTKHTQNTRNKHQTARTLSTHLSTY